MGGCYRSHFLAQVISHSTMLIRGRRKRALECHPDRQPANRVVWATQEMQRVNRAYRLLPARIEGRGAEAIPRTRLRKLCTGKSVRVFADGQETWVKISRSSPDAAQSSFDPTPA